MFFGQKIPRYPFFEEVTFSPVFLNSVYEVTKYLKFNQNVAVPLIIFAININ